VKITDMVDSVSFQCYKCKEFIDLKGYPSKEQMAPYEGLTPEGEPCYYHLECRPQ
jgi:hypothetical protein